MSRASKRLERRLAELGIDRAEWDRAWAAQRAEAERRQAALLASGKMPRLVLTEVACGQEEREALRRRES